MLEFQRHPDRKLTAIAQEMDTSGQLEAGQALYWLRQLLARHWFLFDLDTPYRVLKPKDLAANPHQIHQELISVVR